MVFIRGRAGFEYESLLEKGKYSPKMIMIAGSSGNGKTILAEDIVECLRDAKQIGIAITDVQDETEAGYTILPATDKEQIKELDKQGEKPEGFPTIIHSPFSVIGVKEEIKKAKGRGYKGKLPKTHFFTISIKSLKRDDIEYLCETVESKGTINLFLDAIDSLKDNEGFEELKNLIKSKAKTKKKKYYGKEISSDDAVGDRKDARDILNFLAIFNRDHILMPANYKYNLDIKEILKDKDHYHVFTYKYLNKDEKLRNFMVFHILSSLERYADYAVRPVCILIDEIKNLAPYKAQGAKRILAAKFGDTLDRIRKSGKGFTIVLCTTRYTKTDEMVRDACQVTYFFGLSIDDLDKMKKIRGYTKLIVDTITRLKVGEYIHYGYEHKKIKSKFPRSGHKMTYLKFNEIYNKFFPDQMTDYSEMVSEVSDFIKNKRHEMQLKLKLDVEKEKKEIRKEVKQKLKASEKTEKLKEFEEGEKNKKVEDKDKRNKLIFEIYEKLKLGNKKASYRNIAEELESMGYKVSHQTIANVLKEGKEDLMTGQN